MTRTEIAVLACKILALWVFVQAANFLANLVFMLVGFLAAGRRTEISSVSIVLGLQALPFAVVGILLWWKAGTLAKRMVSSEASPVTHSNIGIDGLMSVAFTTVGLFLFVDAVSEIVRALYPGLTSEITLPVLFENSQWVAGLLAPVTKLVLAVWLMLGSRGIARFVIRLRNPRLESTTESDTPANPQ